MTESLGARLAKTLIDISTDAGADDSFGNVLVIPLRETVAALQEVIWPAVPECPGRRLKALLLDRGITQVAFAEALGTSCKHLSQLINGKVSLSPYTAIRLEEFTGVPAAEWNIAEAAWRDHLIRQQLKLTPTIPKEVPYDR